MPEEALLLWYHYAELYSQCYICQCSQQQALGLLSCKSTMSMLHLKLEFSSHALHTYILIHLHCLDAMQCQFTPNSHNVALFWCYLTPHAVMDATHSTLCTASPPPPTDRCAGLLPQCICIQRIPLPPATSCHSCAQVCRPA